MKPDPSSEYPSTDRQARLLTGEFALLLTGTGIFGLAFSTYFLLPKFLAVELQADAAMIGSVMAVTLLASFLFIPFIGEQIDRHQRKYFACFGAIVFAISCAGFLFVDRVGPLLWFVRMAQGFSFTLFYVAFSTLATDISPPQRLGQAIGLFGAVMISTNALGPAMAEWGASRFGWSAVFLVTSGGAILAAGLSLLIKERPRERSPGKPTSMLAVVKRPGLRRVLIVAVMVGWTFGAVFTFYQPWALVHGYDKVSSYLIGFALFAMIVRIGLGGMADRIGRLRVAKAACVLYVIAPLALIWLDAFGLFVTGSLLGLAHGLFFPALNAVAVGYADASERGKAMAAYNGAFNLGFAAGSYLLGYVVLAASYPAAFALAGIVCFIGFLLLLAMPHIAPTEHAE